MSEKRVSLADAIRGAVSDLDTAQRKQIEYIDIDLVDEDKRNFYTLDGLDDLAANIALFGVMDPLIVRSAQDGRVVVTSGHRRRAAVRKLIEDGNESVRLVPCIRDDSAVLPELQELQLIFANSDTRKMKDADLAKQAERVTELLYKLQEQGYVFPGRMRDHVAEACNTSKTKLATLNVIRKKLISNLMPKFESGKLATETAYQLTKLSDDMQLRLTNAIAKPTASDVIRIANAIENGADYRCKLTCPNGKACTHEAAFIRHDASSYEACKGETCCLNCKNLMRDWSPCQSACSKAKEKKSTILAEKREHEAQARIKEQKKRDKVIIADAQRILRAVEACGASDSLKICLGYSNRTVSEIRSTAKGDLDPGRGYQAENAYKPYYSEEIVKMAKALHCSADYLLGLTDDLTPVAAVSESDTKPTWRTGAPSDGARFDAVIEIDFEDGNAPARAFAQWFFDHWDAGYGKVTDKVPRWYPLPEE